jgi:hypothetical protein
VDRFASGIVAVFFTLRSTEGRAAPVASEPMDRSRRRATIQGRALVGLVVLAAVLSGGLAAGGPVDAHTASDARASVARHAVLHERASALRSVVPGRVADRRSSARSRETFATAVGALAVALMVASRRRLRWRPLPLHSSFVRFGAARAPPALQLQP